MRVINKALLRSFAEQTICEWCGKRSPSGLDPHHIRHKGSGRVDVIENLVALCRLCHTSHHVGNEPTTEQLLALVSRREGRSVASIRRKIDRIRADTRIKEWIVE